MQKAKVADGANANGTVNANTIYTPESWNDNLFNLFNVVEKSGYSLIDGDLEQLHKATRGLYVPTFTYNTSTALNQTVSDIVRGSDSKFYEAQTNNIIGDDPVGSVTGNWMEVAFDKGINPLYSKILEANISVTVGATGDYATINEAINDLSRLTPIAISGGLTATITLQAGFVMQEQLLVRGLNLGWISIDGIDAETTIANASLTTDFASTDYGFVSFPAFGVSEGGTLPKILQLFTFDGFGGVTNKDGILVVGAGSSANIKSGGGVKNAGGNGLYVYGAASANAVSSNFSGAALNCVAAANGATISASGVQAQNAVTYGIVASFGSTIVAFDADVSNSGSHGVLAIQASRINAQDVTANGCVWGFAAEDSSIINAQGGIATGCSYGAIAARGSSINASDCVLTGATNNGAYASFGSDINATNVDASGSGSTGFRVLTGSNINAWMATGTLSQVANVLTVHGTIYQ